jgi:hypothetical protein
MVVTSKTGAIKCDADAVGRKTRHHISHGRNCMREKIRSNFSERIIFLNTPRNAVTRNITIKMAL